MAVGHPASGNDGWSLDPTDVYFLYFPPTFSSEHSDRLKERDDLHHVEGCAGAVLHVRLLLQCP